MAKLPLDLNYLLSEFDSFLYLSQSVELRSLKHPSFLCFKVPRFHPKEVIVQLLNLNFRLCDDNSSLLLTQTGEIQSLRRP